MCGRVDINLKEPLPVQQFSCPASKPVESEDKGVHDNWPWLGKVTDTTTGSTKIGVVLSDDTIVTDAAFFSTMRDSEANFEFRLFHDPDYKSSILSSRLDSSKVLVATLAQKIPPSIFQPVCVPPKNYINKMVKSKSCEEHRDQKITQVTLVGDTPSKAQYDVIDEHRCSLSLLNSTDCAKTFPSIYPSDGIMRKDTEYIEGEYNKKCGRSGCVTDIESVPENFYKCHVGAVTAA